MYYLGYTIGLIVGFIIHNKRKNIDEISVNGLSMRYHLIFFHFILPIYICLHLIKSISGIINKDYYSFLFSLVCAVLYYLTFIRIKERSNSTQKYIFFVFVIFYVLNTICDIALKNYINAVYSLLFDIYALYTYQYYKDRKFYFNINYKKQDKTLKSNISYCRYCGTKLNDNAKFCHICGKEI